MKNSIFNRSSSKIHSILPYDIISTFSIQVTENLKKIQTNQHSEFVFAFKKQPAKKKEEYQHIEHIVINQYRTDIESSIKNRTNKKLVCSKDFTISFNSFQD
uniref:Uncharacterized protein n=1 Tax=Rhizophagus irregularis (strain DAOM 181602 / DAOM 197198 / MUCL 43194) TaxID=747089 RepID=U9U6E7_RHIID